MSQPSYKLRAGASGPLISGAAGDVLTALADGSSEFLPPGGLNTQFVTADSALTELDFNAPATRKFVVTLEASTTFAIAWPTEPRVVIIQLHQAAGGPFVPSFGSEVRYAGNLAPTWSIAAGHWDELAIDWDGTYGTVSFGTNYSP